MINSNTTVHDHPLLFFTPLYNVVNDVPGIVIFPSCDEIGVSNILKSSVWEGNGEIRIRTGTEGEKIGTLHK